MRNPTLLRLIFCAVLAFFLTGCGALAQAAQYTMEDVQDSITETQGIYTVRLGRWTDDVPAQTRLTVDVADDQVYAVAGDNEQLLGKLTYQLPDTPIKTMFLDTGKDKFILGRVDDTIPGHVDSVTLSAYEPPGTAPRNRVPAKTGIVNSRGYYFFVPFYYEEWKPWQRIDGIYVDTSESLQKALQGELDFPFKITYEPYFDVTQHLTPVVID